MQPVSAALGATGTGSLVQTPSSSSVPDTLGKDAFFKLLVAQLRNQNPLQPMDDKEFVSQLAQFSALEQMRQVNESIGAMAAVQLFFEAGNLIGRTVQLSTDGGSTSITGVVSKVKFEANSPILVVDGEDYTLEAVVAVVG